MSYVDPAGDYVNGHRASDVFTQQGPDTAAPCRSTACTARYLYDPRDKLVREVNGHGATTNYTLDATGNITREIVSGDGAKDVTYAYTGQQLTSVTAAGATQKQWYDPNGNLDCVTVSTGSQANCAPGSGGTYSPQVITDYSYDYLDRMTQVRSFVTNGSTAIKDDASDYEYDALDRVAEQTESHGTGSPRTTLMSYLGLGSQVSREDQHNGDEGSDPLLTTKSYAHDAFGHRIGMTNSPTGGTAATYTYGYDVHGSVSLLLGDTGSATASYGYRAYGAADAELTKGDLIIDNPLNAYRYSAKRLDSGSGSIDMGARRFGPDTSRFLQRDVFNGATADLGLALDPLTQNRYALASGNPISFVEWDGHLALLNGGGGGTCYSCIGDPSTIADDAAAGDAEPSSPAPTNTDDGFDPLGAIGDVAAGVGGAVTNDAVQTVLDSCGLISVIGTACDLASAGSYALEGDLGGAGLSLAGILPGASEAVGATRLAARYGDDVLGIAGGLVRSSDEVASSSRAARREATRRAGVPTSQQPVAQYGTGDFRSYQYDTRTPGGGSGGVVVARHPADAQHALPHWHAGMLRTTPEGAVRTNRDGFPTYNAFRPSISIPFEGS